MKRIDIATAIMTTDNPRRFMKYTHMMKLAHDLISLILSVPSKADSHWPTYSGIVIMIAWSLCPVRKSIRFVVWYDENPEN